jgi:hypothetical protein
VEEEAGAGPDGCELEEDQEEPVLEPRDAVGVPLAAAAAGGDGSISFLSSSMDRFVGLVGLVGVGNGIGAFVIRAGVGVRNLKRRAQRLRRATVDSTRLLVEEKETTELDELVLN